MINHLKNLSKQTQETILQGNEGLLSKDLNIKKSDGITEYSSYEINFPNGIIKYCIEMENNNE